VRAGRFPAASANPSGPNPCYQVGKQTLRLKMSKNSTALAASTVSTVVRNSARAVARQPWIETAPDRGEATGCPHRSDE
jgi:hypothetical protein